MNDFLSRVESILSGVMNFNPKSRVEKLLMKWIGSVGNIEDLETYDKSSVVAAINEIAESGGGEVKPYTSLKRLGSYIYEVTFDKLPTFAGGDVPVPGACSSYVQDGKLYRNFDWNYSELASFHVICKGFEGIAISPDLEDGDLSNSAIGQLPYRLVDGCNDHGIRVSTHVLFNDWDWVGTGDTPLYKIPYTILSSVESLDDFETQMEDTLADLYATETLVGADYLLQFVVTDGTTTYAILPPKSSSGSYVVYDISENPKLTNFRWVADATVDRADLQDRPTGVERWNLMPCDLKDLRFTKAYESTDRLSEFIGINGTTKDSTDEELTDIYNEARAIYLTRERDGRTWQTMHSVVYSANGMENLWVQENWNKNYIYALKDDLSEALPVPDGLDATGETDMSTVIQAAINAGNVYLPDGTYRIDAPLTFSGNKQFLCAGELVAAGNGIVVYGQHNAIKVRKITATGHSCVVVGRGGYTEANDIDVNEMSGAIGFEVVDESSGTQYNKMTFEVISATLYGIYVHCTTNYISQTLIYGGLITGGAVKGVYLHTDNPEGDANHIVSSTIMVNGAVEGIDDDGVALEMVKSSYNSFKQLRVSEATAGATKLKMSGVCGHNNFDVVGIDTNTIDVSELDSTSANNVIRGRINTASESRVANALWIDGQNGMTYAPLATHYTNDVNISPTTIDGTAYKVISMAANGYITTELYLNSGNTAPTNYMLGREYSDLASACFGMPLVVRVPSVCKPTIYDADGNVIYDAHDGVPHALALILRCVGSRYAASQKQWEVAETQTANDTIFRPASREWVDANYAEKDDLGDYVAIAQGVAHAGKFLVVGDDGNVTTQSLPIYDGSVV